MPDQDPDRAALGGDSGDAVLGLLASGQIIMRKVDGWQSLAETPTQPGQSGEDDLLPVGGEMVGADVE